MFILELVHVTGTDFASNLVSYIRDGGQVQLPCKVIASPPPHANDGVIQP